MKLLDIPTADPGPEGVHTKSFLRKNELNQSW